MNLGDLLRKYINDQGRYWRQLRSQSKLHNLERTFGDLYGEVHSNAKPIFVLSTGRAGTMLLTRLLEKSKSVLAVHEPTPELSYHSLLAYSEPQGSEALSMSVDLARYELIRDSYLLSKRYVETNNRITFFAYYLADLYPNAQFIHLVRHPLSFIASGKSRNWYSNENIYDEGRIKDPKLFENYSIDEKIAWLWASTNQFVVDFSEVMPNRCFSLKSEDLFSNPQVLREILHSTGIDDIELSDIKNGLKRTENRTRGEKAVPLEKDYSAVPHFSELMERFGYE